MSRLKFQRGFSLLAFAFFGTIVMALGFAIYHAFSRFEDLRSSASVATELVLESSLNYLLNALQNRWCLDETLGPKASCADNADGNTERLILSESGLRARNGVSDLNALNPAIRRPIIQKVMFRQMTSSHPLKLAVEQLPTSEQQDLGLCVVAIDWESKRPLST